MKWTDENEKRSNEKYMEAMHGQQETKRERKCINAASK